MFAGKEAAWPQYQVVELISDGARHRVMRARRAVDGELVILKYPVQTTTDELARLRREYDLLQQLSLPGVIRTLEFIEGDEGPAMALEEMGGTSLDRLPAPLPLVQFLELACGLAETLTALHNEGITHKNICPANILFAPATGRYRLIDFDLADRLPSHSVAPRPHRSLEGTLAFMSPEQTGRMNRAVDYRADFYSLGATFYWLLTGACPFNTDDDLALVHAHIAAEPEPPHERNPLVPESLSRIVLKLMSKMADERYQSGHGLKADLDRCLEAVRVNKSVPPFSPGMEDFNDRLQVPQHIYGRDSEIERLLAAFKRTHHGKRELVLIGGYSGIGKTALVHEIEWPVTSKHGHFIEGKFEQLQRDVPYFAWIEAFSGLVNLLLTEGDRQLAHWRQTITDAVGNIGSVLTDVIPKLELIIGKQTTLAELNAADAQNRFSYAFLQLIRALATREHPLVIFLDDMQWIDAASLGLLKTVISSSGVEHLLIIGAYRDNEVDTFHPLSLAIDALRKEHAPIESFSLGDLSCSTVNDLIARTLRAPAERTSPLSELIYGKTRGNPFFLLETLRTLVDQRAVSFDIQSKSWHWDISALRQMEITDNVVTLMLGKIEKLPSTTKQLLPLAACMGSRFNLASLRIIAEQTESTTLEQLQPALNEGLIVAFNRHYQFAHDRIQQAAYSLIPDGDRKRIHLSVGMLLLQHIAEQNHGEMLFAVVDHLNIGADLLTTEDGRLELAQMNLRAGHKAKAAAAFSASAKYYFAGLSLLDDANWANHYELALTLHNGAAEMAGLVGDVEKTGQIVRTVLGRARHPLDMVDVYLAQVNALIAQGRLQETIDCLLEILNRLGIQLIPHPTEEDVATAMADVMASYDPLAIGELAYLPDMTDPKMLAAMRVLDVATGPVYSGRPYLHALMTFEQVKLSIRYGAAPESMYAYCGFGLRLCGLPGGDIQQGYAFGNLSLTLAGRAPASPLGPKPIATVTGMIWSYKHHIRETLDLLLPLYPRMKEVGNIEYAGYVICFYAPNAYVAGKNLTELERELAEYIADMRQIHSEVGVRWTSAFHQAAQNLIGQAECPWILNGKAYDRASTLRAAVETGNVAAESALHVNTLVLCYLFEQYEDALAASTLEEGCRTGLIGMAIEPIWYLYDSLTRLALYPTALPTQQKLLLERVTANQNYLENRAHHAPMNFLNKWHLVEAELARVRGNPMEAIRHYQQAITLAKDSGFIQDQALTNELAGKFWLAQGHNDFARLHLHSAQREYSQWSAYAKVKALRTKYPQFFTPSDTGESATAATRLDLETVMKATRAISRELKMDSLLNQMLHIVIESAGAQHGFLLMERDGDWSIAARGSIESSQVEIPRASALRENGPVALPVVRFVARTHETVVLDDAAVAGEFSRDPHIQHEKVKSLLCTPLLNRGKLTGILYLENNRTTQAFTPERCTLLETIASQAAISLETAAVYEALRESEAKLRRMIDTAAEGIEIIDDNGIVTFTNVRMAELIGYSHDEIVGRRLSSFFFEEDLPDHEKHMDSRRHGVVETYERRFRHKDGRTLWTIISATPIIVDGVYTGAFAMITDITERRRAEQELLRTNRSLRTLSRCNETLVHASDELTLLRDMCRVVVDAGDFALAWVAYAEGAHTLKVMAFVDASGSDYLAEGERIDNSDSGQAYSPSMRALLSGQVQVIASVADDQNPQWRERATRYGYGSAVVLPLRVSGKVIGILSIAASETDTFGHEEITFLSELASNLGFGIDGLRTRRDRDEFMEKLRASMEATIQALSSTVELRDPYTAGHQRRVAELSAIVARSMGWSDERVQALFLAGMIHDIGKIAVPAEILSKPGKLSAAEMMLVRTHTEAGYELLKTVEFPWPIARIVLQHHERLNGSGYPQGLTGEDICAEARVLAVCDAVEAISSHRPYRPGLGAEAALAAIEEEKGTLFDPDVVDHCVKVIRQHQFLLE